MARQRLRKLAGVRVVARVLRLAYVLNQMNHIPQGPECGRPVLVSALFGGGEGIVAVCFLARQCPIHRFAGVEHREVVSSVCFRGMDLLKRIIVGSP